MIKRMIQFSALLLCALILLPSAHAARGKLMSASFDSVDIYYGQSKRYPVSLEYHITVATPHGVDYGVYKASFGQGQRKGDTIPLVSWTGSGTAPVLTLNDWDSNISNSYCPNLDTANGWVCASQTFNVRVESDDYGCPWIAAVSIMSKGGALSNYSSYAGPVTRKTTCPTVPVDTYDISWEPNVVKHDTVLSINSTGNTETFTLKTYLMESGLLCDKSQYDSRGAHCRFVGTGITLTVKGCDNKNVTTSATALALTDKELHDIKVSVNTKNIGSGTVKSTCSFQYILEQL